MFYIYFYSHFLIEDIPNAQMLKTQRQLSLMCFEFVNIGGDDAQYFKISDQF